MEFFGWRRFRNRREAGALARHDRGSRAGGTLQESVRNVGLPGPA
jgi:hypothetical protein